MPALRPTLRLCGRSLAATHLFFLACLLLSGCLSTHPWKEKARPWNAETIADAKQVRIHRADGSTITMVQAAIERVESGDRITGKGVPEEGEPVAEFDIPLSDVTRLETSKTDPVRVAVNVIGGLGIAALILLGVLVIALASGGVAFLGA